VFWGRNYFIFSLIVFGFVCRRIADGLEQGIPNLETLVLTNNGLQELGDLDALESLKNLKYIRFALVLFL
jgi:hypothetical protein